MRWAAAVGFAVAAVGFLARGQEIQWGSGIGDEVVDSGGAEVSSTFNFELGTFEGGFEPTGDNVDLWEANWLVFDESGDGLGVPSYDPVTGLFGGAATFGSEHTADFGGRQAYVWGYDTLEGSTGEWTLFTDLPLWQFPAVGDAGDSSILSFDVIDADTFVAGTSTSLGPDNVRLHTEQVTIPEPGVPALLLFGGWCLWSRRRPRRA